MNEARYHKGPTGSRLPHWCCPRQLSRVTSSRSTLCLRVSAHGLAPSAPPQPRVSPATIIRQSYTVCPRPVSRNALSQWMILSCMFNSCLCIPLFIKKLRDLPTPLQNMSCNIETSRALALLVAGEQNALEIGAIFRGSVSRRCVVQPVIHRIGLSPAKCLLRKYSSSNSRRVSSGLDRNCRSWP